jgi:hypothetical protein
MSSCGQLLRGMPAASFVDPERTTLSHLQKDECSKFTKIVMRNLLGKVSDLTNLRLFRSISHWSRVLWLRSAVRGFSTCNNQSPL